MALQTSFTFRFADIEVHEPELRVIRAGEPLAVEPKAFRVLIYLLRHAGHLVPKEELLTAVWGDTAVTDNSLTRAIALLRHLLDDDPHHPRYIETVSTVGYRFICPVESESGEAVPSSLAAPASTKAVAAEPPNGLQHPRKMRGIVLAATGAVLAGAAGLTWYALRPLPTLHVASYTQIASVGQWAGIAGSDGLNLYLDLFLPNGNGVVPVSGGRMVPLPIDLPTSKDSPNDSPILISLSPDGSRLLVGSNLDPSSGRKLWAVNTHGGEARYLAKSCYGATWSPDGKTVAYSTLHGDIYTVSREGGDPHLLLVSPAPPGVALPLSNLVWSPDGSRMRFVRSARYWEISSDGKNPHEILPNWHDSNPRYFMAGGHWTPDGDFFVFLAGFAGFSQNLADARQLWALDERKNWLHHANPEPVQLTHETAIWGAFAFSKDGKTLFCTGTSRRGELVRYDAKSKALAPYLGGISAEYVSFSRDGKYLVYVTYPEGTMWRANRDGSGMQQLTGPPFHPAGPEWSPDGTQILFSELEPSHRGEIYIISSQGGTPQRLLPGDRSMGTTPDWSPGGKRIVLDQIPVGTLFVVNAIWVYQGGTSRILDLETGQIANLPPCPKTCFSPRWSPDGRYILEVAADHKSLFLLELRTHQWSQLNPGLGAMNFPRWSRDGRSIYVQDSDLAGVVKSADPGIYRIQVTGGRAEKVVDMHGFRGTGSLSVGWSDLDPDDAPLLLRNVGTYDIYALALERK